MTPLTSTGNFASTFKVTLFPSNSKVPSRMGARWGRRMSLSGSEPIRLVPLRSQNKPARASQPFSRRRLVSTSCLHLRTFCSYSASAMLSLYLNEQIENLQFYYEGHQPQSTQSHQSFFSNSL